MYIYIYACIYKPYINPANLYNYRIYTTHVEPIQIKAYIYRPPKKIENHVFRKPLAGWPHPRHSVARQHIDLGSSGLWCFGIQEGLYVAWRGLCQAQLQMHGVNVLCDRGRTIWGESGKAE